MLCGVAGSPRNERWRPCKAASSAQQLWYACICLLVHSGVSSTSDIATLWPLGECGSMEKTFVLVCQLGEPFLRVAHLLRTCQHPCPESPNIEIHHQGRHATETLDSFAVEQTQPWLLTRMLVAVVEQRSATVYFPHRTRRVISCVVKQNASAWRTAQLHRSAFSRGIRGKAFSRRFLQCNVRFWDDSEVSLIRFAEIAQVVCQLELQQRNWGHDLRILRSGSAKFTKARQDTIYVPTPNDALTSLSAQHQQRVCTADSA